ncbi:hypothetical protein [Aliiroseovarius sp. F20344]|uniref:hypothetical protein n=1 Tax=Aliiroseovarius sp. F20344 TaxID=2926414 RepID=UPI001FF65384|nr:hypothetical protein [Aliiroseovarius sp. F20344]MCK0142269.1 hypothetical protein [Aliiroseovarius sp. F20344]
MLGPAYCFTVLDRAIGELHDGDAADQSKANILLAHKSFAYLGALGPLLREYTPLIPAEFNSWRDTREFQTKLENEGLVSLSEEELNQLLRLHRRAMMVGYGELFKQVRTQWPLLQTTYALLDDLDAIAENEDLSALKARKDDIDALGEVLKGETGDDAEEEEDGEGEEEKEPFGFEEERKLIDDLNGLFRPFLQTEPAKISDEIDDPEEIEAAESAATTSAYFSTSTATWRETELMRWRRTGDFARGLLDAAGDDDRLKAYAYGYMAHVAAAVTGQPFINSIVGGPYRSHWWRHRFVTNHIDSWIYGFYGASADMIGDTPEPPYEDWPELCSAKLHEKIDLGLGLNGLEYIHAVLGQNEAGESVAEPSSDDLDVLAEFLSSVTTDVYAEDGELPLSSLQIGQDFTPESFRLAYLGLSSVLWLQTSGEGPVCARKLKASPPDECFENPPDWVDEVGSPPSPSKYKGALAGSIILAILALISLLTGGLAAGVAALAGAAGTAVVTSNVFWKELRCTLYWTRYMVRAIELKTADFLVDTTLACPSAVLLGGIGELSGTVGPTLDAEGRPLTRTSIPDQLYPRQMNRGIDEVPHPPDIGYSGYPIVADAETPEVVIWPSLGANRYANFALDGDGVFPMQGTGIMEPVTFPTSAGTAGGTQFFGNSVENAIQVIRDDAVGLENFNLDADRGYGWLAWATNLPDLPSVPPFEPVDAS